MVSASLFPVCMGSPLGCDAVVGRTMWYAGLNPPRAEMFGLSSRVMASLNGTVVRREVLDPAQAAHMFRASVAFEGQLAQERPRRDIDETMLSLVSLAGPRRVATDIFKRVQEFDARVTLVERLEEITGVERDMLARKFLLANYLPDDVERVAVVDQFGKSAAKTMWDAAVEMIATTL